VKAGVTGRCYPFGDVAGLATAIDAVRRELPISDAVRTQCREAVRSHTVEQMTDGLLAACRSIARINRSISRVDVAARFDGRETRDRVDATEQMSSAGLPLGAATTATGKIGRNNDRADHL
jgi:hypothetical protein